MRVEEPVPALINVQDEHRACPTILSVAVASAKAEGGLCVCVCQREKGRQKVQERAKRTRWKSIFSGLDPALMISETASSHLSLVFSFRPSWSSSTPAYGTLLPWGRTMRRPLPVSPFFFSHLFSLCSAGLGTRPSQHSLSVSFSFFLSLSLATSTYLSFLSY